MKWIFLSLGFLLLIGLLLWYVFDLKKVLKKEQNDFNNGNDIK